MNSKIEKYQQKLKANMDEAVKKAEQNCVRNELGEVVYAKEDYPDAGIKRTNLMCNINKLDPNISVIFKNEVGEELVLVPEETHIRITTDDTDYNKEYLGLVDFVNEDGVELENKGFILWQYILKIEIV